MKIIERCLINRNTLTSDHKNNNSNIGIFTKLLWTISHVVIASLLLMVIVVFVLERLTLFYYSCRMFTAADNLSYLSEREETIVWVIKEIADFYFIALSKKLRAGFTLHSDGKHWDAFVDLFSSAKSCIYSTMIYKNLTLHSLSHPLPRRECFEMRFTNDQDKCLTNQKKRAQNDVNIKPPKYDTSAKTKRKQ